jgi:glutamate synthase domain-containing protein 1
MLFLPDEDKLAAEARSIIEDVVAAEGRCRIAGWRDVPVVREVVGPLARENEPRIVQVQRRLRSAAAAVIAALGPCRLQPRPARAGA